MKILLNIFRHNLGLKLIALILALLVFDTMRNSTVKGGMTQNIIENMKGNSTNVGSGK